MINLCSSPSRTFSCEGKFNPILTDRGICYAFNANESLQLYQDLPYIEKFKTIYQPFNDTSKLMKNTNGDNSLFLILDSHMTDHIYPSSRGKFLIGINQASDASSILENYVEILPGTHTTIDIAAQQITSSPSFKTLSYKTRNCFFQNEPTMNSILYR